jgi:hypothetical protein
MPTEVQDLRSTIVPKSDQLNTDQLLGGPLVITVKEVRVGSSEEQPVSIFYATDPARPYKPCKTMRKVLIHAWGPDGRQWVGKSMELYAEPSVKFGGELVGGIRISRLTDIPKEIKVSLTATKGRKTLHEIGLLELSKELTEVLEAIAAATGRESLQRAKAMAQKLRSDEDVAHALAAYQKKVEALKEKAAAAQTVDRSTSQIDPADRPDTGADPKDSPAPTGDAPEHPQAHGQRPAGDAIGGAPVVTYAKLADRIQKASDRDVAVLVLDEGRALPADQQRDLQKVFDEKFPEGA